MPLVGNKKHNRDNVAQLLMDKDRNLHMETKHLEIWGEHFRKVFHDELDKSKDLTTQIVLRQILKVWPSMHQLSDAIMWQDDTSCANDKKHIRAKWERITPDVFKLLTVDKGRKGNRNCPSIKMGKSFLNINLIDISKGPDTGEVSNISASNHPQKGGLN